jgi:hypothetical protein
VQHNNTTMEQTINKQVSARRIPWLTRCERQVKRRAMRAPLHEHNKHKRRCWQPFTSFQNISTSDESISIDTKHSGDENSTWRSHPDAQ